MSDRSQTRNYQVIAVTMEKGVLSRTRRAARKHGVSVAGLINLALQRLLDPKNKGVLVRALERSELRQRRRPG